MGLPALTTDALLQTFRVEVDDNVPDNTTDQHASLWSNDEIIGYMNEACDDYARHTKYLTKVVQIPYVLGALTVPLPLWVLDIYLGRLVGRNTDVTQVNANDTGNVVRDYNLITYSTMFGTTGAPEQFVRDFDTNALRLLPTPDANDTLEIQCSVTLQSPLTIGGSHPFPEVKDQRNILTKMKALAYSKEDVEVLDLKRAQRYADAYELAADEREEQIRRYRRVPGTIRMEYP